MAPVRLNNNTRGIDAVRCAIAACVAGPAEMRSYAQNRWGPMFVEKAAVSDTDTSAMGTAGVRAEFVEAFKERNTLGRLRGTLQPAFNTRIVTPSTRPTASVVAQSAAIQVGRFSLAGQTLERSKIASLSIFSEEALEDPQSEAWITSDVMNELLATTDAVAFDPANPASLLAGAPSSASTNDPAQDVAALIADFSGDLMNAAFVADKNTVTRLSQFRDTAGLVNFPDAALIGGSILGIPLLVSRHVPNDSSGGNLILVDGASVALRFDDVEFFPDRNALIEQDSAPSGASDAPAAATSTFISLFQANLIGIKGVLYCGWKVIRPGGVAYVSGTDY